MIDYLYFCYDVRIKKLIKKYRNKKWAHIYVDSGGSYVATLLSIILCPIIITIGAFLIGLLSDAMKWTSILLVIIAMIPLFAMEHHFNKEEYHQRVYKKYKGKGILILPMWILYLMYFVCMAIGFSMMPLLANILDRI